jgi:multiple sugar transport system substrate-binding protein
VRVELVPVGSAKDHMSRLTTAFSGGNPPDLFILNYRRFGQLAARGVLEPLGPRARAGTALPLEDFYPQALEAFQAADGEQVCLPQNVSSLVVYFNAGLFDAAGVPRPREGWTWGDALAAARALTRDADGDGRPEVHGLGIEPSLQRFAPFIWQAGGEVVDDTRAPRALQLRTPQAVEAIAWLLSLRRVHGVTPSLAEARSEDLEARFARGELAMLLQSRRLTATLREVRGTLDWDVAPLPRLRTAATVLHADGYCMARTSQHKDAAFRFVAYALGPEGAALLSRSGRTVPSRRSVAESPAFLDPSRPPRSARVFLDALPHMRRLPNVAAWNEVETRLDEVVEERYYAPPGPLPKARYGSMSLPEVLAMEAERATAGLLQPEERPAP